MGEWENGEITSEPLNIIAADDPVTCAIYVDENDLLELPGCKRFRSIAKKRKKMIRMANQAKLRSFRTTLKYQYGFEVPRDYRMPFRLTNRTETQNGRMLLLLRCNNSMSTTLSRISGRMLLPSLPITRKSEFTLYLRSNMTVVIKLTSSPMVISPMFRSIASTLELFHSEVSGWLSFLPNWTISNYGLRI